MQSYKYSKKTFLQKFCRTLIPFSNYLNKVIIVDCYFYPLRLQSSVMLSVLTVMYLSYVCLQIAFGIKEVTHGLNSFIISTYY